MAVVAAAQVAVQLLAADAWGTAEAADSIKPRVSKVGTSITIRVVPDVASLTVTFVVVAPVLAKINPYKSLNIPDAAAVTIVVSEVELLMDVC